MTRGIIISIILIVIFFFLGAITSAISFVLLAPVIFTPQVILSDVIKIMKIKKGNKVLDLGSGDGRLLFQMQKDLNIKEMNIKLFGYEISPVLVMLSKLKQAIRLQRSITFDILNIFEINFMDYDKIYVYLDVKSIKVLEKKILSTEISGVEIFSYRFPLEQLNLIDQYTLSNGERLYKYIH